MRALFDTESERYSAWQYMWDYNKDPIEFGTYSLRVHSTCLDGVPSRQTESVQYIIGYYVLINSSWKLQPTKKVLGFFLRKFKEKKAQP